MSAYHKDDDGKPTRAGDKIRFSFGIPPVAVVAEVVDLKGKLYISTPKHSPTLYPLKKLRACVGRWWKEARK